VDGVVKVWDLRAGAAPLASGAAHTSAVACLAWVPPPAHAAAGGGRAGLFSGATEGCIAMWAVAA